MNVIIVSGISVISTLVIIFLIKFIIGVRKSQKQVEIDKENIQQIYTELSNINENLINKTEDLNKDIMERINNICEEQDEQVRELDRRFERVYKKIGKK
jgi:predicted PurR-regulated permease PerM